MRGWAPNGPRHGYAYGLRDTTLADRPYRMMGHMGFLDLSEEQQEQLTALRVEQSKAITPLQNKLGELRAPPHSKLQNRGYWSVTKHLATLWFINPRNNF